MIARAGAGSRCDPFGRHNEPMREPNLDLVLTDDDGERLLSRLEARTRGASPRALAGV